ncbi:MAG: class I SAM-dependent methyltransferase [Acidobacteriota bacterium]
MCNQTGIEFGKRNLVTGDVEGKRVVEVGSRDVNGTFRQLVAPLNPAEYVGVDIESGPGVDVICDATELLTIFGEESFDVVISTEMLEHVKDWRNVISNLKGILRPGGTMLITTRSKGFAYHAYPYDFWRFEREDMQAIFSDMKIEVLESDSPSEPGVFVVVKKPNGFAENKLAKVALYSIISGKRKRKIGFVSEGLFKARSSMAPLRYRLLASVRYRFGKLMGR